MTACKDLNMNIGWPKRRFMNIRCCAGWYHNLESVYKAALNKSWSIGAFDCIEPVQVSRPLPWKAHEWAKSTVWKAETLEVCCSVMLNIAPLLLWTLRQCFFFFSLVACMRKGLTVVETSSKFNTGCPTEKKFSLSLVNCPVSFVEGRMAVIFTGEENQT